MVREVASKTSDVAGDGTTTPPSSRRRSIVKAQERHRRRQPDGAEGAASTSRSKAVIEAVDKMAKPVEGTEIAHVGTISANNDRGDRQDHRRGDGEVGKDGVITVEEAKGLETNLEVVEGMQFDRGYLSPYFVTAPSAWSRLSRTSRSSSTRRRSPR